MIEPSRNTLSWRNWGAGLVAPRRGAGFFVQHTRNGALRLNQSCHNPTNRALARTVERTVRLDRAVAEVIPDRPRVARVVDELAAACHSMWGWTFHSKPASAPTR